jgi:hypothetical protein
MSLRSTHPQTASADVATELAGPPAEPARAELADGPHGVSWRETALVALGLAVLAALVFGTHILHRGFYYDDWENLARTRWPDTGRGYFAGIQSTWNAFGYRPALAVYLTTLYTVLDDHMALHLAWIATLAVAMSTTLYVLLRELAFRRSEASAVAALVLVFPLSDSTRLWVTAGTGSLTTSLFLIGAVLSLRAFREPDRRRSLLLHVGGVCFYVISMLFAEVAAVAIPAMFFLYAYRAGWLRALRRSVIDTLAIAGPAYYIASNSKIPQAGSGLSERITRIRTLFDQGLTAATRSLDPQLGIARRLLLGLGIVVVLAAIGYLLRGRDPVVRRELRRWVLAIPAAFVLLAAAYAIYIPADPYYVPLQPGVGNRVNVLAAVGLVVLAAAVVVLGATLIASAIPRRHRVLAAGSLAGLTLCLIGAGYVSTVRNDAARYDRAFVREQAILGLVHARLATPPHGSTIYVVGAPIFEAPGVPVFAASWDFHGAIDYVYRDRSLNGYPILPGVTFVCGTDSMYPTGGGFGPANGARYGVAFILNTVTQRIAAIRNRSTCAAEAAAAVPGPFQLEA